MTAEQAETFERCMSVGGVAVFPADTVYGLACNPSDRGAVERLYRMKRRALDKPSAVMFFDLSLALEALPELGPRTIALLGELLPGPVSVLLPNPAGRFPLACGGDPATLGVRVVEVPALAGVRWPVLQSSANHAGGADARRVADVPEEIRRACEMVVDGGELPGTSSTVLDLRGFEATGEWHVVREGGLALDAVRRAVAAVAGDAEGAGGAEVAGVAGDAEVARATGGPDDAGERYVFDPAGYAEMIRADIPGYERMQAVVAESAAVGARRVLELGTGTGETALGLLGANPEATLVGLDESESMLDAAARRLPADRVTLRAGRLEDPLPDGEYDLVASALCVHHLDGPGKRDLFARVHARLAPGGRFVLADLVVPVDPADAVTEATPGYDMPDTLADQLEWLVAAGFDPAVAWVQRDLAVVVATAV